MGAIGISRANGKKVALKKGGSTGDIIEKILDTIPDVRQQTKGFSQGFTPDRAGLRKLWGWVRTNIHYNEDPLGVQWIRTPARLWHDREGDCKSMTVFIISVLENLGLKYKVRFSNTETPGGKRVNHVYPIAILPDGREVIVDAVYSFFDAEKSFYYAKDYTMSDIYRLSGIGAAQLSAAEQYALELQAAADEIPDEVLEEDITEMSQGDFSRWTAATKFEAQAGAAKTEEAANRFLAAGEAIRSGTIAGIGNLAPSDAVKIEQFLSQTGAQKNKAFKAPVVAIPDALAGDIGRIGKLTDLIKKAWRKIVNWVFKLALPGAAGFFLYAFMKKAPGRKSAKRQAGQNKTLDWIMKAGKFEDKAALMETIKTGIIKKTGKSPEAILAAAEKGEKITGIGAIAAFAVKAISFVIEIISKIVSLFKKKKPDLDKNDAADLSELSTEYQAANTPGAALTSSGQPSGGDGKPFPILPIAIAAGAALLIFSKK